MKLKMLAAVGDLKAGEETTRFSGDEAKRLVANGFAVPAAKAAPIERAVQAPPPETRD